MYKVNKNKCIGCGLCVVNCPDGTEIEKDGKAKIKNQKKVEECGGEKVCPYDAIEKIKEK